MAGSNRSKALPGMSVTTLDSAPVTLGERRNRSVAPGDPSVRVGDAMGEIEGVHSTVASCGQ
jgi:hypothetical protein